VRLCQIVPSLEARYGGPSKSVLALARALAEARNEVELLTTDPGEGWSQASERLNLHTYHRAWPGWICPSPDLRRHVMSSRADVIHHHSIWLRTLHYAHEAARRAGVPFVVSPRGMMDPWAWHHHSRRKALARAFIHPGAFEAVNGWHATSDAEAAAIAQLGFRQPVCVASNGVAALSDEEMTSAVAHWRQELEEPTERPVALFYSRFHRKKRLLELVDTWLEFGPKDWLLLVVGIPEEYTPRMIEDYVLRAGEAGRIRAYSGAGRPPPYGIASLFLLPSHSENFGLAIAEALANGVPALVTDTTPWAGLNQTGSGWCVPWADYGPAIRSATAEGPEALRRRGAVAREWVLREFSWSHSAKMLSQFYAKLGGNAGERKP
jgi:glycosyltransferase involved in cell wall biosynthesis